MRSIDTASKKLSSGTPAQMMANIARTILFSRLSRLAVGSLTVEESGETYTFGQRRHESDINAQIVVNDPSTYTKILFGGATGSGEAYMLNAWSSPDLVMVIRLFVANKSGLSNMDSGWSWASKFFHNLGEYFRINTLRGSKRNIAAHYDLSNDFFKLFLDKSMMYSSAIFAKDDLSLEQASTVKLDHICRRLRLKPGDHLLEIGTGWGGMAIHAAKNYGCHVTTTTISEEQYKFARERVEQLGLGDRVTLLKEDYRKLSGTYDKIVSIEMVEAVGYQYYDEFFSRCSHLLKPKGLMLMQAITTQDQLFETQKDRSDFIRKYIFPGGCLPSNEIVVKKVSKCTDMQLVGLEDITLDYARTLAEWKKRFFDHLEDVRQLGFDDVFIRMWDFYLSYCEGGFSERVINTAQFLFAKPMCRELPIVASPG